MKLCRSIRLAAVVVLGAAAVASAAATASAAVTERGRYHESSSDTYQPGEVYGPGCTFDFPLVDTFEADVNVTGVVRANGIWYFNGTMNETQTWSNPDNGRTFVRVHSGSDRDQQITDNGDGTLTIAVQTTGPNTYYASGKRLFTDTGVVRYTVLVDSAGTPGDPGDDGEAAFVSFDKFSGVSQTDGRDFCADLQTYLG